MTTSDALERLFELDRGSTIERSEWLFEVLYALPAADAIEIARSALARYLSIFRAKHSEIAWPATLLADVGAWAAEHDTGLVDDPDYDSADTTFRHGLHAVLVAWTGRADDALRTAATATAIIAARSAFQTNVWAVDDPEAFRAWATGDPAGPHRAMVDNAAAIAVGRREWSLVLEQIRAVWSAARAPAKDALEAALDRWRSQDYAPL
jgi:hypothetical protein